MAWDKTRCEEGILAPDLNNAIRAQYADLEAALTKEMNFATGGTASLQGILKQGGARCFFQATAPATRADGSAFASTDLGLLWIDSDDNKFYFLTATTPTWTSLESVTIATLLAATRQFAEAVTFDKAAVLSKAPTLTEGIVANNSYLQARNAADDGNVDLMKTDGSDVPTVPDDTANATSGAPTANASLANKKYVDDIEKFTDRGDPSSHDFTLNDFTTDGTSNWRDLDLSSIVSAGATAVLIALQLQDNIAGSTFLFRKNGNSNAISISASRTQVASVLLYTDLIVACDTNRIIEYAGSNLTFDAINFTVKGWWK